MQEATTSSSPKPFLGLCFFLCGFDPLKQQQVRSKLVSGGGVESQSYSHLIVDNTIYDDPVCISARNNGKTVVTGLWVDHSFDIGLAVDPTSMMYQPPKDLNGIPGADRLIVCLTGYQRHDRDDIMTMVGLMGSRFSKPLVANKVTHLICYKFEGEKYELARKMQRIKLVNHRWLEDCLRNWKLLPEDDYSKSGYELEVTEAEAKDSEEDVADTSLMVSTSHIANPSPQIVGNGSPKTCNLLKPTSELSVKAAGAESSFTVHNVDEVLITPVNDKKVGMGGSRDRKHASDLIPAPSERTPGSVNVGSKVESVAGNVGNPLLSNMNSSPVSFNRKTPQRSPSSLFVGTSKRLRCSPEVRKGELVTVSSAKVEIANECRGSGFEFFDRLASEELSEGKKLGTDGLKSTSRSHQIGNDIQASERSPSMSSGPRGLKSSLVDSVPGLNNELSGNGTGSPNDASNTHSKLTLREKSLPEVIPFGENENLDEIGSLSTGMKQQIPFSGLKESISPYKQDNGILCIDKPEVADIRNQQARAVVMSKTHVTTLEANQQQDDSLHQKQVRKHAATKKTLGSRMKLKNTVKEKGSIYLKESTAPGDLENDTPRRIDRTDGEDDFLRVKELEIPHANVDSKDFVEKKLVIDLRSDIQDNTGFMDDETEPPDDRDQLSDDLLQERMEIAGLAGSSVVKELEEANPKEKSSVVCDVDDVMEDRQKKDTSILEGDGYKRKKHNGQRLQSMKSKRKVVSTVEAAENKSEPDPGSCPSSRKLSRRRSRITMEADKENKAIVEVQKSGSMAEKHVEPDATTINNNQEAPKGKNTSAKLGEISTQMAREPMCFIVSGHRPQRKEFQQVIRRLKGKSCRDSHQWSYQATHFIASDPIRRTEKFFAAAASGRWILKTDYMSACSQAGKFLPEEPYEWYKNGLTEDGAINLEAPRKWRLLRERTGHGAFHGMRIVIYGECISPPLETLKRVVKAGDGTILATSPPYSRLLSSRIDYAIVSPGMPRVDVWVQEFLSREIPCIVADYLVEYVCKSGYSLEKHVLFNTQKWAEKSFSNLMSKAEEIVIPEDRAVSPSPSPSDDDVACQVCGSRDRGEVMLLCGDQSGSVGCGGGRHIDCCVPPLQSIPEEDWFCPNCSAHTSLNPSKKKKRKKGTR